MNQEIYEKIEYALALIADKNDEGVDILYKYMGKTMLFVACGVIKDDFLAEDVVQDSFLKIIQNIDQYKKGTNGYSWICRIVRNTAINAVRKSSQAETCLIDEFDYISDGRDYEDELTTKVLGGRKAHEFTLSPDSKADDIYEIFSRHDGQRDSGGGWKIKVLCFKGNT